MPLPVSLKELRKETVAINTGKDTPALLQYFEAVRKGKQRASQSQMKLFDVVGFAMLTLTTKKVSGQFLPVGEEEYGAIICNDEGHVVLVVDEDGFTKSQSKAMSKEDAFTIFAKLPQDIRPYPGTSITLWARTCPTVHAGN